jgi:hypothetical protein
MTTDIANNPLTEMLKRVIQENPEITKSLGLRPRGNLGRPKKDKNILEVPENLNLPDELKPGQAKLVKQMLSTDPEKPKKQRKPLSEEQKERLRQQCLKMQEVRRQNRELEKRVEKKEEEETNPKPKTKTIKIIRRQKKEKIRDQIPDTTDDEISTTDEEIVKAKRKVQKKKELLEEIDKEISRLPQPQKTGLYSKYLRDW